MKLDFLFILNIVLFGVGKAMDAFSISLANGLYAPDMQKSRALRIAGTFGLFQLVMPLTGWICIHTIAEAFQAFQRLIPWIALALLLLIGGKMVLEGIRNREEKKEPAHGWNLFLQGVATSIDALSVGFAIAEYRFPLALLESGIIGAVTFVLCLFGIRLGKKVGTGLSGKATILGGMILILIGIEVFVTGLIG